MYDNDRTNIDIGISVMSETAHQNAVDKGFYDDQQSNENLDRKLMLIVGEVSEAHEALRKGTAFTACDKGIPLTSLEEELADIIIRVGDLAGYLKIDLGRAVVEKMDYNSKRPRMHGNKKF